jgi:hypothetical protein
MTFQWVVDVHVDGVGFDHKVERCIVRFDRESSIAGPEFLRYLNEKGVLIEYANEVTYLTEEYLVETLFYNRFVN